MKNFATILLLSWSIALSYGQQHHQHQPFILNYTIESTSEVAPANPFTDYRMNVTFTNGDRSYMVPGFYAADGDAAQTGADSGGVWRCIFTPDTPGTWKYVVSFRTGASIATESDPYTGKPIKPIDGKTGSFKVTEPSASATYFAKHGRLTYPGNGYLHYLDSTPLLKFGANSPENFLAYEDFDGTYSYDPQKQFIKSWSAHTKDWSKGDPTWGTDKGKGIIGALNYLASHGMNAVYALTLNIDGDARDVWPFTSHERSHFKRYDVSKLAQWDIVFSHAERLGIIMHLITQETENELLLDDGYTTEERKLYYRELVARFGYHKNIIWNMGEENGPATFWRQGQSDQQRFSMIRYLRETDPYNLPLVIHTLPNEEERLPVITPLLGYTPLDGLSLQIGNVHEIHEDILRWKEKSITSNHQWLLMMDEIGPWHTGTRTDADDPTHDTLRQEVLWGTLMAGGAGVEWYFGWNKPPNDLNAEDWRSRENIWIQSSVAKEIFSELPYTQMINLNQLVDSEDSYCFGIKGSIYMVYIKKTVAFEIELASGKYTTTWVNPRTGEKQEKKEIGVEGTYLADPPPGQNDWLLIIEKQ